MKPTVLIATTTRWFPTARLGMSLSEAGFHVEAICPASHPLSKTGVVERIRKYHNIRPLASFRSAIEMCKPDLIIPGDDLATHQLHLLHRDELARGGSSGGATCAAIERSLGAAAGFPTVFARSGFLKMAREAGIRAPKTAVVRCREDLAAFAREANFPLVLKADGTSGGDGVKIVRTIEDAERAYEMLAAPPFLARALKRSLLDRDSTLLGASLLRRRYTVNIQEFAPGGDATSAIACWKGKVLASLHCKVIRKAQACGHATVLRVIENPEMSLAAERMADRLQLSGLHGLDFMLEEETGQAHLIEINPRSTQIGHLALAPRQNLTVALYTAVTGRPGGQAMRSPVSNDTIALFPQEWIRDPGSPFLQSAYHDVPWRYPELLDACIRSRRQQTAWYSIKRAAGRSAQFRLPTADNLANTLQADTLHDAARAETESEPSAALAARTEQF